ncbi:Uncharacterised protein [Mycobacteroides abscessus subsp. abscessus]|nr:Uncharacterised protein [Mycobacteroides abscessus subsp. abscessus]
MSNPVEYRVILSSIAFQHHSGEGRNGCGQRLRLLPCRLISTVEQIAKKFRMRREHLGVEQRRDLVDRTRHGGQRFTDDSQRLC